MQKIKLLIIHSSPFLLGIFLSYLFWRSNALLFFFYIILVLFVVFSGKDKKTELWIFLYGIAAGFVIETIGTQISGYQKFIQPDILGIPYWLLISWGYGFILMKRISLIIANNSPWIPK